MKCARVFQSGLMISKIPHGAGSHSTLAPSSSLATAATRAQNDSSLPDYPIDDGPVDADWVAGMFMLFRREAFRAVGGFDRAYLLYYEDVDICERLWRSG